MDNFIVNDWFAKRADLKIQAYVIEGVEFQIMALSDDQKETVELCDTYEDMLSTAANGGLSYNRKRISDDEELKKDIDALWEIDSLDIDCDPCIKYLVGEKICEISGLASVLEEKLAAEEAARVVDGDGEFNDEATMGEIGSGTQTVNI